MTRAAATISYQYDFGGSLNDYPKFGVWPIATNSAYLATYNMFTGGQNFTGAQLCAYDRNAMLSHQASPAAVCFTVANDGNFLPSDLDGATPPPDGTGTLSAPADIAVAPFTPACNGGACIPQPNKQTLDSLGDRLMYRLAYRMFGDHASMVVNHSVTAGSSVGVRWYELQAPIATPTAFSVAQQGTFAPDSAYRWMGSAAMDGAGNIAIGYSKSSSNVYPSIAVASRTPTMPLGTMGSETILQAGSGAQTTYDRWGDYTSLRIDPDDDTTFWYTNEYYSRNSILFNFNWSTAIASFKAGGSSTSPDFGLAALPNSLTVSRGSYKTTNVSVTAINGSSSVNLRISGLPRGVSASFTPNPVTATGSSTLKITANRNAATGPAIVSINGNNGSASHGTSLTLNIQ